MPNVRKEELDALHEQFPPELVHQTFNGNLRTLAKYSSGNRLVMHSGQCEQRLIIKNPEHPWVFTGYENAFGDFADSLVIAESNYKIISMIPRFISRPKDKYVYIVQDMLTGVYDVIEVRHYEKLSETHGYVRPITSTDLKGPGDVIFKGDIISKAPSHDEYGNYCAGFNTYAAYINLLGTAEDGIMFSDTVAKDIVFYQLNEGYMIVNKNHVLLDMYGDGTEYKCLPEIGEYVKDNILCTKRIINLSNAASELTASALRHPFVSDEAIYARGRLIDIDVFINDIDECIDNAHRHQLMLLWLEQQTYYQELVKKLSEIVHNKQNTYTLKLNLLYNKAKNHCDENIKFSGPNGEFEFALIKYTTCHEAHLTEGCKVTNRFSSKSVICHIKPESHMPRDRYGNIAHIVMSPAGVPNRSNPGQWYYHEINFISLEIMRRMSKEPDVNKQFAILYDYYQTIDLKQAQNIKLTFEMLDDYSKEKFIFSIIEKGIRINIDCFPEDDLYLLMEKLYAKYEVKPSRVRIKAEFKSHGEYKDSSHREEYPNHYYTFTLNDDRELDLDFINPYDLMMENKNNETIKELEEYTPIQSFYVPNVDNDKEITKLKKINGVYQGKSHLIPDLFELDKHGCDDDTTYSYDEDRYGEKVRIRDYLSIKPVIIAPEFFMLMKQMADNKLSARNVGSVNALGSPIKSSSRDNESPIGDTPIKFGEMELQALLSRCDPILVLRWIATNSTNPQLRSKMFNMLLFQDPLQLHNLDITKEELYNSIPAKQLDAYLFCIGYEVLIREDNNDIYTPFDGLGYTAEEMLDVIKKQFKITDNEKNTVVNHY